MDEFTVPLFSSKIEVKSDATPVNACFSLEIAYPVFFDQFVISQPVAPNFSEKRKESQMGLHDGADMPEPALCSK